MCRSGSQALRPRARGGADARAARRLARGGSSRLDRDLDGDDDAGPAPGDLGRLYPKLWAAVMAVAGARQDNVRNELRRGAGFTGGGFWYIEKELGARGRHAARSVRGALLRRGGRRRRRGVGGAGTRPGRPGRAAGRPRERIAFRPGLLPTTIRYTNRPSGIQQVISFGGHRPRATARHLEVDDPKIGAGAGGVPRPSWRTPPSMIAV